MKILYLDSFGHSMGMLAKAMCQFTNADADCIVRNFDNRRKHQISPHETIAKGAWSENDLNSFLNFAIDYYDIIQTTSLPWKQEDWDLYDWITQKIGRRHVWVTGFVHGHFPSKEVDPYEEEVNGFNCTTKTFKIQDHKFLTGNHLVFYSFPEKKVYLKGDNIHWLPTIRDPALFKPFKNEVQSNAKWNILCTNLKTSILKGRQLIKKGLFYLKQVGYDYDLISNKKDIYQFENWQKYPIPYWEMPKLYNMADIVIDSIYTGGYGNPTTEAMLCEKPVVGFSKFEEQAQAPIVNTDRSYKNLARRIIEVLENPQKAAYLGKMGREYAIKYHSPRAVAKLAYSKYENLLK